MLTATYAIVNLSVEQEQLRTLISQIQQFCRSCSTGLKNIRLPELKLVAKQLTQFDESCHRRKIEMHMIPSIRHATHDADALIAELELLNAQDDSILGSLQTLLSLSTDQWMFKLKELCGLVECYRQVLLKKLEKEDAILTLAKHLLRSEQWFAIGMQFFLIDAQSRVCKQCNSMPASDAKKSILSL